MVNLSRNFGKEAALTAGIDHARGDILIPMDIDLQDPPELIGPFIERWREGYDIVYGVRQPRAWDTVSQAAVGQLVLLGVQLACRRCASRPMSATSAWSTGAPSRCCASCPSATAS